MPHWVRFRTRRFGFAVLTVTALAVAPAAAQQTATPQGASPQGASPQVAAGFCPTAGWAEGLGSNFQRPDSAFPTQDTPPNADDCRFHQWSVEAFVWATTLINGVPRFTTLATEDDLLSSDLQAGAPHPRVLKLAARSTVAHGLPGYTGEGAGAFVQADGNVLISPNGYPVYTSVHMNPVYFDTAKQNLIVNGGYQNGQENATFPVGAAVFKATWLRLAANDPVPIDAYTTQAQVPVLTVLRTKTTIAIVPVPGQFTTATVVLVGLHVVGVTINHPEFLWGTFQHTLASPEVADNTFTADPTKKDPNTYMLYQANTPFSQVNIAATPPSLTFNPSTQRFAPATNAVLQNSTGGENQTGGVQNVTSVNTQGQSFFAHEQAPQSVFSNYNLIGTVWMQAGTFNVCSNQTNAVGSVSLANVTAETFVQGTQNAPITQVQNCFMCHNPASYSFQSDPPPLANRLVAVSHTLAVGTSYAVPNMITGNVKMPFR